MNGWMDKENVHTYSGLHIYMCIQSHTQMEKEGTPATYNMDGPWNHYAKWSKSETDKYCMILLICGT